MKYIMTSFFFFNWEQEAPHSLLFETHCVWRQGFTPHLFEFVQVAAQNQELWPMLRRAIQISKNKREILMNWNHLYSRLISFCEVKKSVSKAELKCPSFALRHQT